MGIDRGETLDGPFACVLRHVEANELDQAIELILKLSRNADKIDVLCKLAVPLVRDALDTKENFLALALVVSLKLALSRALITSRSPDAGLADTLNKALSRAVAVSRVVDVPYEAELTEKLRRHMQIILAVLRVLIETLSPLERPTIS